VRLGGRLRVVGLGALLIDAVEFGLEAADGIHALGALVVGLGGVVADDEALGCVALGLTP